MPIQLDVQYAMANGVLANRGISRRSLAETRDQLLRVESEFAGAIQQGLIPIYRDSQAKIELARELSELMQSFDEIWIVAETSLVRTLQLCASKEQRYVWINSLTPELYQPLENDANRLLISMTGPKWVTEISRRILGFFSQSIQCSGDGTADKVTLIQPEGRLIEEDGIADMRFAMFSSLGLALQNDTDLACGVYQKEIQSLQQKGMWENPASLLACCIYSLDTDTHPAQLSLIGARDSWSEWLKWGSALWSGMTSQVYSYGAINKRIDGRVTSFVIGDELGMNELSVQSSNSIVCLMEEGLPLLQQPTDLTSTILRDVCHPVWESSHQMIDKLLVYCQKNTLPVCICEVKTMSGDELLALSAGWLHSVLVLNALRGADPLAMWGADQWRDTHP